MTLAGIILVASDRAVERSGDVTHHEIGWGDKAFCRIQPVENRRQS